MFGRGGNFGRRRNPSDRSWWVCAYTVDGVSFSSTRDINIRWMPFFVRSFRLGMLWVYLLPTIVGHGMVWGSASQGDFGSFPLRLWSSPGFAECCLNTLLAAERTMNCGLLKPPSFFSFLCFSIPKIRELEIFPSVFVL